MRREDSKMVVFSVRLPEGAHEILQQKSSETGIPPAVLARSYLISALGYVPPPPPEPPYANDPLMRRMADAFALMREEKEPWEAAKKFYDEALGMFEAGFSYAMVVEALRSMGLSEGQIELIMSYATSRLRRDLDLE